MSLWVAKLAFVCKIDHSHKQHRNSASKRHAYAGNNPTVGVWNYAFHQQNKHQNACHLFNKFGKRVVRLVPYVHDLLFAHQSRNVLDPIVEKIDLLQYRFVRGGRQYEAMTVRDEAMEQFIRATKEAKSIEYYATEEVSPLLYGKKIRIVGGRLDGLQGRLMSRRGSKTKRIILDLEECSLSAAVEVEAEYIQIIKEQ